MTTIVDDHQVVVAVISPHKIDDYTHEFPMRRRRWNGPDLSFEVIVVFEHIV
jgi:hypothetical protein